MTDKRLVTPKMERRFSLAEMRELRSDGWTDADIGRAFDFSRERIGQILGRRGEKPPEHTPDFKARMKALWARGLSTTGIAAALDTTKNAICSLARRNRKDCPARRDSDGRLLR